MVHIRFSALHRLILITLIIAAVIAVSMTSLTYYTVQSGISEFGQTVAEESGEHLRLVLGAESESLRQTAFEWAVCNETRDILNEKKPGFVQKNLDGRYVAGAGITRVLFYNSSGTLRYGAVPDGKSGFSTVSPDNLGKHLLSDNLIGTTGTGIPQAGLYRAGDQMVILAVHPVSSRVDGSPAIGTVVVVRDLAETYFSRMTTLLPASVRITASLPDEISTSGRISSGYTLTWYDESSQVISTAFLLDDLLNRPVCTVFMQIPYKNPLGIRMILALLGIILTGFGIFIVVIYSVFTRFFLGYTPAIFQELDLLAPSGRDVSPVSDNVPPDIAPLAGSANRVIHSLDDKQISILRSEHARKSVEIRWEILFRSAAEAILIGDEEGVLTCNPQFESLVQITCEDLVGTPVTALPFCSQVGDGTTTLKGLWDNSQGGGERFIWKITPDTNVAGKSYVLDANLRFVEMNGKMLRFLICRDITEEVRLQSEQEQAICQIDENLAQLAALNDELRNPLTMISAWAELDNSPNRNKIMDGVQRINEIVDRVDKGYVASEKVRKYLQKSIDRYRKRIDSRE